MYGKLLVGIDIGSSEIKAVAFEANDGDELQFLGEKTIKSKGVENGLIKYHNEAKDSITDLIKGLQELIGRQINEVYLSVPSGSCKLVPTKGEVDIINDEGIVEKRDIKRAREAAARIVTPYDYTYIQLIEHKYNLDEKMSTKNPYRMKGRKLELQGTVVLMSSKDYKEYLKLFQTINLEIAGFRISSEAAAELLIDDLDKNRGVVLVDCGKNKIDIAGFKDGKLQEVIQLSIGGNTITRDISYCFKINEDQAEEIKGFVGSPDDLSSSSSIDFEMLKEVIDARLLEMGEMIDRELKNSKYSADISNVIIYGKGISSFKNIANRFSSINDRKVSFVSNELYDRINSKYINSRGLVNLVSNELKWEYEKEKVVPNVIEENVIKNIKGKSKITKKHGIVSKMKSILEDLF